MTQMPPTPQESAGAPAAGRPGELLDRFLARLIDGVILGVAYGIFSSIFRNMFLDGFIHSWGEVFVYYLALSVVFTALALAYFAFLDSTRGQTLGKMVMKLQVVAPGGGHPTVEQSVRRNIFYAAQLISIVPVLGWILGPIVSLVAVIMIAVGINNDTVLRQGWHDKFAGGTTVVKLPA